MAITGIFFGSDTGNTENIAKMIQKQLGKDVADVHDIAKAAKKIWKHMTFCCWASQPGITAKRSVTGMTSSRLSKRLILMVNWLRCLVVATRKITQNTSAMHWAPSATSLNRAAQLSLVTGNRGLPLRSVKGLADDDHFVGLAIDEDRQPELTAERVEKWVKQISEELHLDEILNA